jgi:uncharacterized protein with FMN-binding domain
MKKHVRYGAAFAVLVLALAACPQDGGGDEYALPALTGTVTISGDPSVGQTLTADTSALDGAGQESCQWFRDSAAISGAGEKTYVPVDADVGKPLLVKVRRAGYSGAVSSAPTPAIGIYIPASTTFTVTVNAGGAKFYSLPTGNEVSDPASTGWDIGFWAGPTGPVYEGRTILTNSGVTADEYGSGGQGGIYPAGTTLFANVTLADKKEGLINGFDYTPYHTDTKRWISGMSTVEKTVNVASYIGWGGETTAGAGLSAETPLKSGVYNKFGFFEMPTMGYFTCTKQVYIVKHGDGVHYSAVQIKEYTYGGLDADLQGGYDTYTVIVRPLTGAPGQLTPGTYTGQAAGYGGSLSLSATFSASSIDSVVIGTHSESADRPAVQQALTGIPAAIVAAQRLDVDGVSGATLTSGAIRGAVENCVVQAGGNPADFKNP